MDVTIFKMTIRQGIDHLVEVEIHHTEAKILVEILDKA